MYDKSSHAWAPIGLLSNPKSLVAVASVSDNAMIVIGGCVKGDTMSDVKSSSARLSYKPTRHRAHPMCLANHQQFSFCIVIINNK